ncbi:hypothetical protein HanHA300_Chr13g0466671 [Helianthus annuus]|nr:hypothetical protein HanHA300_Chr13g0466671 [Helianthus annuus]KAJ0479437.1 hypothetical protein HanIR_Chr13g0620001 [Helianthus annuus]KAJ0669912.1 hypothetical protein HanOQP8_Chr13g0467941 [Helianthus annuus]KAJ0847697.1 hypothetical protein HanPSC8_Chr13g0548231 [Helianthus annuus]
MFFFIFLLGFYCFLGMFLISFDGLFVPLGWLLLMDVDRGPILQAVPGGSRLVPVMPHGADRFIGSDDDGVARMVEGRFLNQQPDFYNNDYWKL